MQGAGGMAGSKTRLEGLDALRGIAAVSVMLYHYTAWFNQDGVGHLAPGLSVMFSRGHFGVELFFIISGFVISLTLSRTETLRGFVLSRFARLYPAFLACMAVTILVSCIFAPGALTLPQIMVSLTMVPRVFGVTAIDGSYWSLFYEILFYALAAFWWLGLRCRAPEGPCAVWMAVALIIRLSGWATEPSLLSQLTGAWFAHLFVIGVMLFRLNAGQATWLTWVVLAIALETALLGPHWSFRPVTVVSYGGMILGFTLLVWFASRSAGAMFAIGPMRALGRISYPLYLVHQAAGFVVIARLERAGASPDLTTTITVALAVTTAWAISTWVEWPAQRWLRSLAWPTLRPALEPSVR